MRRRHLSLIMALFLLAALVGGLGWTIFATIRQERLNHALIAAIKGNDTKTALTLLDEGADPNARDESSQHLSLWRLLLDRLRGKLPAPSTAPTALLLVCSWEEDKAGEIQIPDNAVLVKTLLDKGATIEVIDHRDLGRGAGMELLRTPLLWATGWNKTEESALLITRGANVNATDTEGETPLKWAVSNNNEKLTRLLINRGADVNHKRNDGYTPLKFAKATGNPTIIQMLKQAGAKE